VHGYIVRGCEKPRTNLINAINGIFDAELFVITHTCRQRSTVRSMLIVLLLLGAQVVLNGMISGEVDWFRCPTNCSCASGVSNLTLTVDCRRHAGIDRQFLSEQIDLLLSNNGTSPLPLTSLRIANTDLEQIPRSVCRLTTLVELHLDDNELTGLRNNCLSRLPNLVWFSARRNAIETLQDGVFDGLTELRHLHLSRNRIRSIGLSVFTANSRLDSLIDIVLAENNLTSLEPWVIDRGRVGSPSNRVRIDLDHNKIVKFTNRAGRQRLCREGVPFAFILLRNNSVKHFVNIWTGWGMDTADVLSCYRVLSGYVNIEILTDGRDIPCDCINYDFYKTSVMRLLLSTHYRPIVVNCTLTDPLTRNSSIVNGFHANLSLFVCELTESCPPRCVCVHRPYNFTLHVYCSNTDLDVLPLELPKLPDSRTKYKLDFSENRRLRRLNHRDYFVNTSILDVSKSGVSAIDGWEEIVALPQVNLFGNNISSLPPAFRSFDRNATVGDVNLDKNPWNCSCENRWMAAWFRSVADQLTHKVLCHSPVRLRGKNIIQISDDEFCEKPSKPTETEWGVVTIAVSSTAGLALVLLCCGFVVFRLRVRVYTRWKLHPFDRDECVGEDMDFDVFLSCSSDDNLPHANEIRQRLEERAYRVCYPPRDFLAGDTICDNIYRAIVTSKRTVCVLTENFVNR